MNLYLLEASGRNHSDELTGFYKVLWFDRYDQIMDKEEET